MLRAEFPRMPRYVTFPQVVSRLVAYRPRIGARRGPRQLRESRTLKAGVWDRLEGKVMFSGLTAKEALQLTAELNRAA